MLENALNKYSVIIDNFGNICQVYLKMECSLEQKVSSESKICHDKCTHSPSTHLAKENVEIE